MDGLSIKSFTTSALIYRQSSSIYDDERPSRRNVTMPEPPDHAGRAPWPCAYDAVPKHHRLCPFSALFSVSRCGCHALSLPLVICHASPFSRTLRDDIIATHISFSLEIDDTRHMLFISRAPMPISFSFLYISSVPLPHDLLSASATFPAVTLAI